jgi:predicted transcriptional regulator
MAGKIKTMSQIKQLLIMHKQGWSKKSIAKALGMSKNTVKSYLLKLELLVNSKGMLYLHSSLESWAIDLFFRKLDETEYAYLEKLATCTNSNFV